MSGLSVTFGARPDSWGWTQRIRSRVEDVRWAWRVRRANRKPWAEAESFEELCYLTASWLERELPHHPGYPGPQGPDQETDLIAGRLAAANRAGFLTHHSQPGDTWVYQGHQHAQCAEVGGYCIDSATVGGLVDAARDAGLDVAVHAPASGVDTAWWASDPAACWHYKPGQTIPSCVVLRECVPDCGGAAQDQVLDAWQICIRDPRPGRAERLDAALDAFTSDPRGDACSECGSTGDPEPCTGACADASDKETTP